VSNDGFPHHMERNEEYHKRNRLPRPPSGRDLKVGPPVYEPGIPSTPYFNHSQILTFYRVFEKSLCKYMLQYSRQLYTKMTSDAHNTPALFCQQSVPTLVVLCDHTLPSLLGLTLLNNHRSINNNSVTFRTPCITCVSYTFHGCNIRSCILNTYQTTDSVQLKSRIHLIFMDLCIVDDSIDIPTRCSFVIEFIIPKFIEGSSCFERHTAHHQEL
jgi:hypothetical protein